MCQDTKRVIAKMLTESTGTVMTDSGGDRGRFWQANKAAVGDGSAVQYFDARPTATLEVYGGEHEGKRYMDASVTIDLYHWLCARLQYAPDEQARFDAFVAEQDDESWHWLKNEWAAQHDETYIGGGVINSYNSECWLSQTIEFCLYEHAGETYCALQIHGGADPRWGYTAVKLFRVTSGEVAYMLDFCAATVYAESDDGEVKWSHDDAILTSEEHGDLKDFPVSFDDQDRGRGHVYVDRDAGLAYCPVSGGQLRVEANNCI